jgi:hypothetical protein
MVRSLTMENITIPINHYFNLHPLPLPYRVSLKPNQAKRHIDTCSITINHPAAACAYKLRMPSRPHITSQPHHTTNAGRHTGHGAPTTCTQSFPLNLTQKTSQRLFYGLTYSASLPPAKIFSPFYIRRVKRRSVQNISNSMGEMSTSIAVFAEHRTLSRALERDVGTRCRMTFVARRGQDRASRLMARYMRTIRGTLLCEDGV